MTAVARGSSLTPLEIASGIVFGVEEDAPGPGAAPSAASARDALEAAVLPALQRPPCVVSFSGGLDSSAVLAVASSVARREGLPLPVAVTLRFPGNAEADETSWQESVVSAVPVGDWDRIEIRHELSVVGPVATEALREHGLLWPFNAYVHVPVFERARGGLGPHGVRRRRAVRALALGSAVHDRSGPHAPHRARSPSGGAGPRAATPPCPRPAAPLPAPAAVAQPGRPDGAGPRVGTRGGLRAPYGGAARTVAVATAIAANSMRQPRLAGRRARRGCRPPAGRPGAGRRRRARAGGRRRRAGGTGPGAPGRSPSGPALCETDEGELQHRVLGRGRAGARGELERGGRRPVARRRRCGPGDVV